MEKDKVEVVEEITIEEQMIELGQSDEMVKDEVDIFDDVQKDDELANMDLSDYGSIEEDIAEEHLKFATKEFKEFLKVAKQTVLTSGRDVLSRSIGISAEDGKAVFRVTDFDVYLEFKLDLLNQENVMKDFVVVPLNILEKLTKATPVNIVLYKNDGYYYIKLVGGDIVLETYKIEKDKFLFKDTYKEVGKVNSSNFYSIIKDMGNLAMSAIAPNERRIVFEKDKVFTSYVWAIMTSDKSISTMDLKIKDINILKSLLVDNDEELIIYATDQSKVDRKVVEGKNFKYAFLVSTVKIADRLKDNMDNILSIGSIYVDFVQFYKMIELAAELPYSVGKVGLNLNEDNAVSLSIKIKNGKKADFIIGGTIEGMPQVLKKEIVIQARLLKVLLKAFSNYSSIKLNIADTGLGVSCEDYKSVVYLES